MEHCREQTPERWACAATARADLGEINSSQAQAWRRSIEVFEDGVATPRTLSLFPDDQHEVMANDASVVRVRLNELKLWRPRQWAACWLALKLWEELQLDSF